MDQQRLKEVIYRRQHVVVLNKAGISVPSEIPDFRSSQGLYQNVEEAPETILSASFFRDHPDRFYDFYRSKMIYTQATFNCAHLTLARLEKAGRVKAIITQNIDGLHQQAGSLNVIELHGSIHRNFCQKCKKAFGVEKILNSIIPLCVCGGIIKPDVILYEEPLHECDLAKAIEEVGRADCLIVVGTSLLVNPAAALVHYFRGNDLIIINKSVTPYDNYASLIIRSPLETVLTEELLR